WPKLRKDHEGGRDGGGAARDRAGRYRRVDGARCHIATAGKVEMNCNRINWRRAWALGAALVATLVTFSARAQNAVEAVNGSVRAGVEVVRIAFAQPLAAVPAGFSIQAPARVALDVPGASNGLGKNTVEINQGNVRSVNIVQAGDRTRLVL